MIIFPWMLPASSLTFALGSANECTSPALHLAVLVTRKDKTNLNFGNYSAAWCSHPTPALPLRGTDTDPTMPASLPLSKYTLSILSIVHCKIIEYTHPHPDSTLRTLSYPCATDVAEVCDDGCVVLSPAVAFRVGCDFRLARHGGAGWVTLSREKATFGCYGRLCIIRYRPSARPGRPMAPRVDGMLIRTFRYIGSSAFRDEREVEFDWLPCSGWQRRSWSGGKAPPRMEDGLGLEEGSW